MVARRCLTATVLAVTTLSDDDSSATPLTPSTSVVAKASGVDDCISTAATESASTHKGLIYRALLKF